MHQYLSGMPMINEDVRRWWLIENLVLLPGVGEGSYGRSESMSEVLDRMPSDYCVGGLCYLG